MLVRELCSHSSTSYSGVASRSLCCSQAIRNISNFTLRGSSVTVISLRLQFTLQPFTGRPPPAFPSCSALNLLRVLHRWDLHGTSVERPPCMLQKSACLLSKTVIFFCSCCLPICNFSSGPRHRSLICLLFERPHLRQKQSQNHRIIGWKRALRSSSPTIHPTPPCLLNHIPKCHIYTFFEHLQEW